MTYCSSRTSPSSSFSAERRHAADGLVVANVDAAVRSTENGSLPSTHCPVLLEAPTRRVISHRWSGCRKSMCLTVIGLAQWASWTQREAHTYAKDNELRRAARSDAMCGREVCALSEWLGRLESIGLDAGWLLMNLLPGSIGKYRSFHMPLRAQIVPPTPHGGSKAFTDPSAFISSSILLRPALSPTHS